jgi:hypothetical protein
LTLTIKRQHDPSLLIWPSLPQLAMTILDEVMDKLDFAVSVPRCTSHSANWEEPALFSSQVTAASQVYYGINTPAKAS